MANGADDDEGFPTGPEISQIVGGTHSEAGERIEGIRGEKRYERSVLWMVALAVALMVVVLIVIYVLVR